ncbi:MAG: hypothetical protein OXB89_04500, partial [Anaerolineaceae bacterium]|nr:hypothetical protein [Anaerolineaceae bacterium]
NPDAIFDQEMASLGMSIHPGEYLEATGGTGDGFRIYLAIFQQFVNADMDCGQSCSELSWRRVS